MHLIQLYIIHIGEFLGPEEMNDFYRKMTHMRKMDAGFTVIESYKFLTVVSCKFCQLYLLGRFPLSQPVTAHNR